MVSVADEEGITDSNITIAGNMASMSIVEVQSDAEIVGDIDGAYHLWYWRYWWCKQ